MPPNKRTKAEKRALRQAEQRNKARSRYETTLEPDKKKGTRQVEILTFSKITSHVEAGSIYHSTVKVNVGATDRDGSWSWGEKRDWNDETALEIESFFAGLGDVTWGVIYQNQHHGDRPIIAFCPEAHARWYDLGYEQFETTFKFRVTGVKRIYGIRIGDIFHLVWFDPCHSIMPSPKKHT